MPEPGAHTILLAEDDLNLGHILAESLEMKGFSVLLCRDGMEAWDMYRAHRPELCILDVMMPKEDGFTLTRRIRNIDRHTPIIFLTAKSMQQDRIEGLKLGADDYLTKPFSMEELVLRIQAVLRRTNGGTSLSDSPELPMKIGRLTLDPATRRLSGPQGEVILTTKEFELLSLLILHKNQLLPRDLALNKIWQEVTYYNARSMDVYISKLRHILKSDPQLSILTVHRKGFKLVENRG